MSSSQQQRKQKANKQSAASGAATSYETFSDDAILHQTNDIEASKTPLQLYEDLAYWQTRVS